MKVKKWIAVCAAVLAAVILIALGYTTPYSVTTEVLTLDEIQELDNVFDANYLPYLNLSHALDRVEQDLNLPGPPTFGKIYLTRSRYALNAGRTIFTVPVVSQYVPEDGVNWLFEFRVLSMAWTGDELVEASAPAVAELSLQVDADPGIYIGYSGRDPNLPGGVSGTIRYGQPAGVRMEGQLLRGDEDEYQVVFNINPKAGTEASQPTTALWTGEFVMRQGLRGQRFEFSLPCVTDYSE